MLKPYSMTDDVDSDRGNPLAAISEEDAPTNHLREFAIQRMDDFWIRMLRLVAMYDGSREMALDALVLAIGKGGVLIPEKSAVEVAKKHLKGKAAVTKLVKTIQDCMGLEPMPGQRCNQGRSQMSTARKAQLQ